MFHPDQLLVGVRALSHQIEREKIISEDLILSDDDQAASDLEREKALTALRKTIALLDDVDTTSSGDGKPLNQPAHSKKSKRDFYKHILGSDSTLVNDDSGLERKLLDFDGDALFDADTPSAKDMSKTMADGVKSQQEGIVKLASAMAPIINKFDEVLKLPNLQNYSAVLTSVPVVGIQGNKVMYVNSKSVGAKVIDSWAEFGALPEEARISTDQATHLFPYKGDLCLAVGTSIWKREHRGNEDPKLKEAVNHWPNMYKDDWKKIGDRCLPDKNVKSIIPFAVLSAARDQIDFHLVTLTQDNVIMMMDGDDILGTNNKFRKLENAVANGPGAGVIWKKMAYWNNRIVALDQDDNTWNLTVDFAKGTYQAADKFQVANLIEMTATNIGPVGLQKDGYLYRRLVEVAPEAKDQDMKYQWEKWIPQNGVTNLGCASPGVMLDLHLLTSTLRARYIETQTSLYPVVNKLSAFGKTHNVFLQKLLEEAKDYQNAGDEGNEKKQKASLRAGKKVIAHSKAWAKIMTSSTGKAKESVNVMTDELKTVKSQLELQTQKLRDELMQLESRLREYKDAYQKLSAAFWGMVATALVGLGLTILAVATGVGALLVVAAGGLFVAGVVAAAVLGSKMADMAQAITQLEQQIRDVKLAIEELTYVTTNFQDLGDLYGQLNLFWGTMYTTAMSVKTMDTATAELIGADSLDDTSSIEAAISETEKLTAGSEQYLKTLNEQGIKIDDPEEEEEDDLAAMDLADLEAGKTTSLKSALKALQDADFGNDNALEDYEKHMEAASDFDLLGALKTAVAVATGGSWIGAAGAIVAGNISMFNPQFGEHVLSPAAASIRQKAPEAKQNLLRMLTNIDVMAKTAKEWADRLPRFPTSEDDISQAEQYQKASVRACVKTLSLTTEANNAFLDITRVAQQFKEDMQLKVNQAQDALNRMNAARDADWNSFKNDGLNNLIPNAVLRPRHDLIWIPRISELASQVRNLQVDLDSGLTCHDQATNLQQLCQSTQGHLGAMYNLMTSIRYNILEDAVMYEQLLHGQWLDFAQHIESIRASLGDDGRQQDGNFDSLEDFESGPQAVPAALVEALSPARTLGSSIRSQAQDAAAIDRGISDIRTVPYAEDIMVKIDQTGEKSVTLAQVVIDLRTSYSQIMSYEYEVIQQFSVLSTLQKIRLAKLQQGQLKVSVLLSSSKVSLLMALKAADQAFALHQANALQFDASVTAAENTVKSIKTQLAETKTNLSKKQKEYKDRVIGIIVYAGFNGFLAGALVASVLYGVVAAPAIGAGSAIIPGLTGAVSILGGGEDDGKDDEDDDDKPPVKDKKDKSKNPKDTKTKPKPKPEPNHGDKDKEGKHDDDDADDNDDKDAAEDEDDQAADLVKHTTANDDSNDDSTEEEEGEKSPKDTSAAARVEKVKSAVKDGQKAWAKFMAIKAQVKSHAMTTEFGRSVFGDTSLEALSIIVAALQSACITMEKSIARLEAVRPPLVRLEKSVDSILEDAKFMHGCVKTQLGVYAAGQVVEVDKRTVAGIVDGWGQIGDATSAWLDVINEQGIAPVIGSDD